MLNSDITFSFFNLSISAFECTDIDYDDYPDDIGEKGQRWCKSLDGQLLINDNLVGMNR